MLELRWLEKERPIDAFVIEGSVSPTYRVLQYRVATEAFGLPVGAWSEWQDVPTVKDQP